MLLISTCHHQDFFFKAFRWLQSLLISKFKNYYSKLFSFTLRDSNIQSQEFFLQTVLISNFTFTNISIIDVKMAPSSKIFLLGDLLSLKISDLIIRNLTTHDPLDTKSIIFDVSNFHLDHFYDSFISKLDYSNSSVQLLKMGDFIPPLPVTKSFIFESMNFHD